MCTSKLWVYKFPEQSQRPGNWAEIISLNYLPLRPITHKSISSLRRQANSGRDNRSVREEVLLRIGFSIDDPGIMTFCISFLCIPQSIVLKIGVVWLHIIRKEYLTIHGFLSSDAFLSPRYREYQHASPASHHTRTYREYKSHLMTQTEDCWGLNEHLSPSPLILWQYSVVQLWSMMECFVR